MLQHLRDKAQGWFTWVIIGLITLTFVIIGMGSVFTGSDVSDETVAIVNGQKIPVKRLLMEYQFFMQQQPPEQIASIDERMVKSELLKSLIDQTLLFQTAKHLNMVVSPSRIETTLQAIPSLKDKGKFSPGHYQQFLNTMNMTDKTFRQLLQENLLLGQLQASFLSSVFSTESELKTAVKFMFQKRDFNYIHFNQKDYLKDIKIKDLQVKNYYQKHLKKFVLPEKVSLEYIKLSLPEILKKQNPSQETLKEYYEQNKVIFTEPERVKLAHIFLGIPKEADSKFKNEVADKIKSLSEQIKKGAQFEQIAQKNSQDTATAKSGGNLGWLAPQELDPTLSKAAFSLKKGQVSEPIKSDFGWHLLKISDKQSEKLLPFDEVKSDVLSRVQKEEALEEFTQKADLMANSALEYPDSLQVASEQVKLPIHKTATFSQSDGMPSELANTQVLTTAFSPLLKEDKNNSDLIKLDEENYVVIRIADYIAPKQQTLDDVKHKITQLLEEKESQRLAKMAAKKVLASLLTSKASNYPWQRASNISGDDSSINPDIVHAAFELPRNATGKLDPTYELEQLNNGDYAIIQVVNIKDGDFESLTSKDKKQYDAQLAENLGKNEYDLYVTYLSRKAKIKNNFQRKEQS